MRVVTQIRVLFWFVVLACVLGGSYELSKARGLIKPKPHWEERCVEQRTQVIPVQKRLGSEWVLVDQHRPICVRTERVCVVPHDAHPKTCKGAA